MTPRELLLLVYLRAMIAGVKPPLDFSAMLAAVLDDLAVTRKFIAGMDERILAGLTASEIQTLEQAAADKLAETLAKEAADKLPK